MSPDWAAKPATVPYAEFGDPQSLNLYSYTRNSPIVRVDGDGHDANGMLARPGQAGILGTGEGTGQGRNEFRDAEINAYINVLNEREEQQQQQAQPSPAPAQQQGPNVTVRELGRSPQPEPGMDGAQIKLEAFATGDANDVAYNWQQTVTRSNEGANGEPANVPFNDNHETKTQLTDTGLYFNSKQQKAAMAGARPSGGTINFYDSVQDYKGVSFSFHAKLTLIGIDAHGKQTPLWSGTWGFSVNGATGAIKWDTFTGISR
jgi:hypothetical protein